jgi:hypothetical protein
MEIIIVVLIIALVVSNANWLLILLKILKQNQHERWELNERIKSPEIPVPPPTAFEPSESIKEVEQPPVDEFELVGKVDPPTPLRED